MDAFHPLTRRQSLAIAVLGPVLLAVLLGLLGRLLGIPAQAGAPDVVPVASGEVVKLPPPPAPAKAPPDAAITPESVAGFLAAGACADWPRSYGSPDAAVSLRYAGPGGTFRYLHGAESGSLERLDVLKDSLGSALKIEPAPRGAVAFVLVSAIEPAGAKGARLESAAAAGRAAERLRGAAEARGVRAFVTERFDPKAAVERFHVPATEVPIEVIVLGARR